LITFDQIDVLHITACAII